ncbi:MAG: hypothetical protein LE178_03580 [Endomicrobium sp.]|nr:hypothetical protein [Endomicrobium sp.]
MQKNYKIYNYGENVVGSSNDIKGNYREAFYSDERRKYEQSQRLKGNK